MPKISYVSKRFSAGSTKIIDKANEIIEDYQTQGYDLTLRQLYYVFVSKDIIPNKDTEYKRLGSIVADARMAGLLDWEAITDRTRNLRSNSHWGGPTSIIASAAASFAFDKWEDQDNRVEVWIEKDALAGILEKACTPLDVPYFSCRGYTSLSEMWSAAMRLKAYEDGGQQPIVFHLGDHDPSGIDMSRDIRERLSTFGVDVEFRRLALNMDQIDEYNPPPNPAKMTDSRFEDYQEKFGDESWELDALEPAVMTKLIQTYIKGAMDHRKWKAKVAEESGVKDKLYKAASNWDTVAEFVEGL